MKRLILCIIISVLTFSVCGCGSAVTIDEQDTAVARFNYGDKDIEMEMSENDYKVVAEVLNGKELIEDVLECSFDENISIVIDDNHYCIARDTCGIVYVKEEDKYLNLSEEENNRLRELLESYGFTFPCL